MKPLVRQVRRLEHRRRLLSEPEYIEPYLLERLRRIGHRIESMTGVEREEYLHRPYAAPFPGNLAAS